MTLPTPTPPEWLVKAVRHSTPICFELDSLHTATHVAQAVWDALLAEGWIEEDNFGHTRFICARRLCIHLPITEGPFKDEMVVPLARHNDSDA